MRSKLFLSVATALLVSSLVLPAKATEVGKTLYKPTGPLFALDLGRSLVGIIQGVITLCGDGDAKAELIAVQQQTNKNADGTADDSDNGIGSRTGTVTDTALQNTAYGYLKTEVLDQTDLSKYSELQQALSNPTNKGNSQRTCQSFNWDSDNSLKTCMAVVNTFFADMGREGNTREYKNKIANQRQAYANKITERHITMGYTVQQKVVNDLKAAAQAPVSSDNEVGLIAIDGQTLDEMLKIAIADVALQIEMMEADAVAFLMQQPVEIMSATKESSAQ